MELRSERIKELEAKLDNLPDDIFIQHIASHLNPNQKVICKICGKSVEEIVTQKIAE